MSHHLDLNTNVTFKIDNFNFKNIVITFFSALSSVFEEYLTAVLLHKFEELYSTKQLAGFLKVKSVGKKSTNRKTYFKVFFGRIQVPQIQVIVIDFDGIKHQMSITRRLLGVSPKFQIPDFMKEIIGWIGAITTFRVGHNIIQTLTNFKCSLMSVWSSVQWFSPNIKLELATNGTDEVQADGTGIPTLKTGKRGSELKKLFQIKKDGKLHLIGIAIGKYKNVNDWKTIVSEPLLSIITQFGQVFVSTDGDKTIINTVLSLSEKVKIQFDIWHVFHQMKYYLWSDGLSKEYRSKIISLFYRKTMLLKCSTKKRDKFIKRYLFLLKSVGLNRTASYLKTAMTYFYTFEKSNNKTKYTSKTERSMRTTNQRINVGVWSETGALNVAKIRDAYYYNGISPLNWKKVS